MITKASLRIIGEKEQAAHTARRVTEALGITPSRAFEIGDPFDRGRTNQTRRFSAWYLDSPARPEGGELALRLHDLLDLVEPVAPAVWDLERAGYWVNWFCYLGSHAAEHSAEVPHDQMLRLVALPGDLWLDVYDDREAE